VAYNFSFKFLTSVMLLPIWILLFVFLKPSAPQSWWGLLFALPALGLAAILRYVLQYSLAMIAFWTTRVEAINQLYMMLDSFLSGRIAPLALLPGWLGILGYFSPFRWMGAFPVELALGRVPISQVIPGYGIQIAWLCAALLLFRAVWAAGIKQYSAVGA
jgi:ABC-2 type transport system permease protein